MCETCGKSFKDPGSLKQHVFSHGDQEFSVKDGLLNPELAFVVGSAFVLREVELAYARRQHLTPSSEPRRYSKGLVTT